MENESRGPLLVEIPSADCKPEQVARWNQGRETPTFRLLRDPMNLEELNELESCVAIWRDNETLTYVAPKNLFGRSLFEAKEDSLFIPFYDIELKLEIVGKADYAIAETAAYFVGLTDSTKTSASQVALYYNSLKNNELDFIAAGSHCFSQVLRLPSSELSLFNLTLSPSQSETLAEESHPVQVSFLNCVLEDGGTSLINALEHRQSKFGSLGIDERTTLTDENLDRLLQLDVIDHLSLPLLDPEERALRAFAVQVESLKYAIWLPTLLKADFQSFQVVAKKLDLNIEYGGETIPTEATLSFLQRLATLGHFEELRLAFYLDGDTVAPECLYEAIMHVALANSNLKVLDLTDSYLDWGLRMEMVFESLQDHKGLSQIKVSVEDEEHTFGPDFVFLRQFLSRNRNVIVTDASGCVFTDEESIDELYALNRFYQGSSALLMDPPLERLSLVATTLLEAALSDFQRSALLFSNHVDLLCQIVQAAGLDDADGPIFDTQPPQSDVSKRTRETQFLERSAKQKI
ncbi:hypothetical protein FisN_2Hu090 [Fistulifera solaris]|uniref:Uncharacterized protein n=1 Tax=Fistulifera solaris TaxID=1519565 RepID=A0A1Z5KP83_FISSO|nr:hypothetical protein FisN_2Hu090 [Fistulifera solaris]|eukprot:GAX28089.1 hypothetical protein FisN_2Hu090 [Fistulifera solaris]